MGARATLARGAWTVTAFGRNLSNELQKFGVFRTGDTVAVTSPLETRCARIGAPDAARGPTAHQAIPSRPPDLDVTGARNRVVTPITSISARWAVGAVGTAGVPLEPFRRQVEIADDPRLDGTVPRDAARPVPVLE